MGRVVCVTEAVLVEAIRRSSWNRDDRRGNGEMCGERLERLRKVRSQSEVVRQFGGSRVAKRLVKVHGFDRAEYVDFLVSEARNESNPVELRFEMFERLNELCLAVAAAHPGLGEKIAYLTLEQQQLWALRRELTNRKKRSGRSRGKGSCGGKIVVGNRRDGVSPFVKFSEKEGG